MWLSAKMATMLIPFLKCVLISALVHITLINYLVSAYKLVQINTSLTTYNLLASNSAQLDTTLTFNSEGALISALKISLEMTL